jgi:secreted Zn-dependent insulinase-like peptidase
VVSAFASNLDLVPGLAMLVQSPVADEVELRREFELFIAAFTDDVERLTEADLQRYKDSLLSSLTEKPKNLGELNGRFMESLKLGYKDFDFRTQLADAINAVSVGSLQKSYRQIIVNDSRRLWVTTAAIGEDDTAIDLRVDGQYYRYDF